VSVYASSQGQLQQEAAKAAESAPWRGLDGQEDWIPEGAAITVERVELLREPSK
jgi:hypothetical protein